MSEKTRSNIVGIAGALLSLSMPLFLLLTSVRLLLTQTFVQVEYRLPGFPEDPYGFSMQDRLRWAPVALDYLLNSQEIDFLGDLRFEDGSPVYNGRELEHMLDVKHLTALALDVWLGLMVALAVLAAVVAKVGNALSLWSCLRRGALWTIGLMAALGLGLLVGFSSMFVGFHQLFFDTGTWVFRYSDTLIRLFPVRFWRDAFTFIALGTVAMASLILLLASSQLAKLRRSASPGSGPSGSSLGQ